MSKAPWPADAVERRDISRLTPYARNARTHSDEQVAQIAASIKEWGWTMPVLVDEHDGVIAGHGRLMAARKLGLADVPVLVARGWTEAQKRAYVLADNKLTLNGGWDNDLLKVELEELGAAGFDLALTGFDPNEIAGLTLVTEGLTDPDETPPVPEISVTAEGDLWICGRHRLLCGDSTSASAIDRLAAGSKADLLFTSPPYAQQRDYGAAKEKVSDWDALMSGVFTIAPVSERAQILVNLGLVHRDNEWLPYWDGWIEEMRSLGWKRFGFYVWDKGFGAPGDWNGRLAPAHEFIFHFNREAVRANKSKEKKPENVKYNDHGTGLRGKDGKMSGVSNRAASLQTHKIPDSVLRVSPHMARSDGVKHPAMFPVALVEEIYGAYPFELAYEPFSGSGTQIIAAQKIGKAVMAMELDPAYVDVAVKRWQDFTGQDATLEGDGRTFNEIATSRGKKASKADGASPKDRKR